MATAGRGIGGLWSGRGQTGVPVRDRADAPPVIGVSIAIDSEVGAAFELQVSAFCTIFTGRLIPEDAPFHIHATPRTRSVQ